MRHEAKRPVTLEDLLRLKRAERPAPEFWKDFDRQLRAKQLAALVGRRPWWRELPGLLSSFARPHLSMGVAVTAAAVSLIIWNGRESERHLSPDLTSPLEAVAAGEVSLRAEGDSRGTGEVAIVTGDAHSIALHERGGAQSRDVLGQPAEAGGDVLPVQVGATAGDSWQKEISPAGSSSPRYVEASLLRAGTVVGEHDFMGSVNRFELRAAATRVVVDPLPQVALSRERRGGRLLTAMVSVASAEKAMRVAERAANRLSEEELYDQIRRFGARGAGVSVKF